MSYVSPEAIRQAKQMDLLTYLQSYEPNELVKLSGNTYCTRQHDSLKISNGKWHWFSRGIGGRTALDYLIKVKDCYIKEQGREILEIIAGPCFLCDCSGDHFGSLSEEQLKRYEAKYRLPEDFMRIGGEVVAIPYKPKDKGQER